MRIILNLFLLISLIVSPIVNTHAETDAQKLRDLHSLESLEDYGSLQKPKNLPSFDVSSSATSFEAGQSFIYRIINVILFLSGLISMLFIMIGGFKYVTNAGEAENKEGAKRTIIYAIAGLLVVLMSYAIVENTIRYIYDDHYFQENRGQYDQVR